MHKDASCAYVKMIILYWIYEFNYNLDLFLLIASKENRNNSIDILL